jgi:signal transduction histidine kinase
MARLDASEEFDLQDVKIEAIIGQVVTQFSLIAQIKGVLLTVQLSDTLPIIRADEEEIIQAVGEIVDNAIMFTPGGGRLLFGLRLQKTPL